MKKCLLLLTILCVLCTGCSKGGNEASDNTSQIPVPEAAYEYSCKEKSNGSVRFTIEGSWEAKCLWKAVAQAETIIEIKENQSGKKAQYDMKLTAEKEGYEQIDFVLVREDTGEELYTITLLLSAQEKKLKVEDVFYSEAEKAKEEETTSEKKETQDVSSLPKEITVKSVEETLWEGKADGTKMKKAVFSYQEKDYRLLISDKISLSEFQNALGIDEEDAVTKKIQKVEVYGFFHAGNGCTMWKGTDGLRYYLYTEDIEKEKVFETVALFLK